jgi:hypothetical protein
MGNKIVDLKDARFIIYDQFNIARLFDSERFSEHSQATIEMIINNSEKLAVSDFSPANSPGDKIGFVQQNIPLTVDYINEMLFFAANQSLTGSSQSAEQKDKYKIPLEGHSQSSSAYLHALNYAREKKKGLTLGKKKSQQVPIIEHPAVRKNLLWMKCFTEGTRALILYTIYCMDLVSVIKDEDEKRNLNNIIEVLTPICIGYSSKKGFDVCVRSLQVYGGYDYGQEYYLGQLLRDCKITTIMEGTDDLQSNDLVVCIIGLNDGAAFQAVINEMKATVEEASSIIDLSCYAGDIGRYVSMLQDVRDQLLCYTFTGQTFLAYSWASQYLDIFGDIVLGWMFLWQVIIARDNLNSIFEKQGAVDKVTQDIIIKNNPDATFLASKIVTAKFYIGSLLPEVRGKIEAIQKNDHSILKMDQSFFID